MKNYILLLALTLCFVACKQEKITAKAPKKTIQKEKIQAVDTILLGDLNHDAITDSIFVTNPYYVGEEDVIEHGCINNLCDATIRFSCKLPNIPLQNAIGATIENMGDINQDGFDELIIVHQWFIGCWGSMYFYTFKNNQWHNFGSVASYLCSDDTLLSSVKKINNNTIEATEKYMNEEGDIANKTMVFKLNAKPSRN